MGENEIVPFGVEYNEGKETKEGLFLETTE
jgi:hypothetical protein